MLDIAEMSGRAVYLIFHYRIADVLNQTAEFTRILGIIEKSFNPPLLLQWDQISTDILQFPVHPRQLDFVVSPPRPCAYCFNLFLLFRSFKSLLGTGWQSLSLRVLTLGANDSIADLFAFVRCRTCECHG